MRSPLLVTSVALAAAAPGCTASTMTKPIAPNTTGTIETTAGPLTFELYDFAAPQSVANFKNYVESGLYRDGSFYRATDRQPTSHGACCITIVQGGVLGDTMHLSPAEIAAAFAASVFPPVKHEPTDETGLRNLRGAIAYGRSSVDTATSEFFISLEDNPLLDKGGEGHPDGQGYAVFGQITSGLGLLDGLRRAPRAEGSGPFAGQLLAEPLRITRITLQERPD